MAATRSPADVPFWRVVVQQFRVPALLLLGAIVYGTAGFVLIERWAFLDALYMTVITLTTVGFREVHPLSTAGHVFTITLTLSGVVILFVAVASVANSLFSGELGEPMRRRRMQRRIDALSDHYIICAYGRVGRATAAEFAEQGTPFVVIEAQTPLAELMEEHGVPYLIADPTQTAVLERAGIHRARGLVCAVDSDAINVYITLTARTLNPKLAIVARASAPESVEQLQRAGANRVVSPYTLSGKRMASLALQPSVVEFFDMVAGTQGLRLEEIEIGAGSSLDGRTVGEAAGEHRDVTILAVKKAGAGLIASPPHDQRLAGGDIVVALGPVPVLGELARTTS